MVSRIVKVPVYQCQRCGHEWMPRTPNYPKICPKCKSVYWDRPPNKPNAGGLEKWANLLLRSLFPTAGPIIAPPAPQSVQNVVVRFSILCGVELNAYSVESPMIDLNGKRIKITIYIAEEQEGDKTQTPPQLELSTLAQQQAIYSIATGAGWKDYEIKAHLDKTYGVDSTKKLTKKQASEVIDYLKKGQWMAAPNLVFVDKRVVGKKEDGTFLQRVSTRHIYRLFNAKGIDANLYQRLKIEGIHTWKLIFKETYQVLSISFEKIDIVGFSVPACGEQIMVKLADFNEDQKPLQEKLL